MCAFYLIDATGAMKIFIIVLYIFYFFATLGLYLPVRWFRTSMKPLWCSGSSHRGFAYHIRLTRERSWVMATTYYAMATLAIPTKSIITALSDILFVVTTVNIVINQCGGEPVGALH